VDKVHLSSVCYYSLEFRQCSGLVFQADMACLYLMTEWCGLALGFE